MHFRSGSLDESRVQFPLIWTELRTRALFNVARGSFYERIGDFAPSDDAKHRRNLPHSATSSCPLKARPKRLLNTTALISPFETQHVL